MRSTRHPAGAGRRAPHADLEPSGSELHTEGASAPLANSDNQVQARLTGVELVMRDAYVGEQATVDI
ncbi:DUF6004 family protein [Kitasatospora sp. NPDC017646]|uniref:DUF6004 family protein n=1 Tax=Kitasatospora sp. NPDC017646 TaxID=3364024 RepID=UPI0037A332D1